ncbi:hypothetical protein T12_3041 [Trichinella patagoniensis]|uniref:Uncharacterized protein n=1 Tax=Trichinella patagoniensis TaxID=990121 RepID=A0A0V0YX34_9BILA|nr:hypothetical protein T12_3041 [Trichinella patagoniensis]
MQFTLDVAEALTKVNKAYARKSRGRVSVTANTETSRRRLGIIFLEIKVLFSDFKTFAIWQHD